MEGSQSQALERRNDVAWKPCHPAQKSVGILTGRLSLSLSLPLRRIISRPYCSLGDWEKLHNEDVSNVYPTPGIKQSHTILVRKYGL
jgi:hypothetical protein